MTRICVVLLTALVSLTLVNAQDYPPTGVLFVGVGYDLIDGNPFGGDQYGGVDPGLLATRNVIEFTYNDGKTSDDGQYTVPDQIDLTVSDCQNTTRKKVIPGELSYQFDLKLEIDIGRANDSDDSDDVDEAFFGFEFTGSAGFSAIREGIRSRSLVYLWEVEECTKAVADLVIDEPGLTRSYVVDACALPTTYDENAYMSFISAWGTHVVVGTELGIRVSRRQTEKMKYFVRRAEREFETSIYMGGRFLDYSASIGVNVDTYSKSITSETSFNSEIVTTYNGNEDLSEPIDVSLIRADEIFQDMFWSHVKKYQRDGFCSPTWRSTLAIVRLNMKRALVTYPLWRLRSPAEDPPVQIPITWPLGVYGVAKPLAGCPQSPDFTFHEGWRFQDTENSFSDNYWSASMHLAGPLYEDDMQQNFCMKTQEQGSDWDMEWPEGRYCLYKAGSTCPDGFEEGYIYHDDEDTSNDNGIGGSLPTGTYNKNTKIYFCCREDGLASRKMYVPMDKPFYLLQKSARECQTVVGMTVTAESFRWDDEDVANGSTSGGSHPYDTGGRNNHELHFCYYEPTTAVY